MAAGAADERHAHSEAVADTASAGAVSTSAPPAQEPGCADAGAETASPGPPAGPLRFREGSVPEHLSTFGWEPRPGLSTDANGMDLALLLARNSVCRGGSMGCAIVSANGEILACGTNGPIAASAAKKPSSDIHAEVSSIGRCARRGLSTEGCTAYITMPPCKKCFCVLVASGVARIVSRKYFSAQEIQEMEAPLQQLGIPFEVIGDSEERKDRLDAIVRAKRKRPPDEDAEKKNGE